MLLATLLATATCAAAGDGAAPAAFGHRSVAPAPPARGIVKSLRQMSFSTDLAAAVSRVGRREGETFRKGEMLVTFDCRRQQAELASLEATVGETEILLQSQLHLVRNGATNRNDVEVARARHAKASAEVKALTARLEQCTLVAPFDGSVYELAINEHELAQAGRPFLTVVGSDDLEVELIVASSALGSLSVARRLDFRIDETGRHHTVEIVRLSRAVDPVSQTIKLYARFSGPHDGVLAGMSGEARPLAGAGNP